MDDRLLRFFKKVGFNLLGGFEGAKLIKVDVSKEKHTWDIYIEADNVISVYTMSNLVNLCSSGVDDVKKISIHMSYKNIDSDSILEYFLYYLDKIIEDNPSLTEIDKDKIEIDEEVIKIYIDSKNEELTLKKEVKKIMNNLNALGLNDLEVSYIINEDNQKEILNNIEKRKKDVIIPKSISKNESEKKFKRYERVDYQREGIVSIESLTQAENSVNVEALIFASEFNAIPKKDGTTFYFAKLKITDNTSSILGKIFASDEDDFKLKEKELSNGKWYRFFGSVRYDDYEHDFVYNIRSYKSIDDPTIKRIDEEKEKRVELHTHTMMSQMDGVCDEEKLVDQAIKWGHAGIAITDHDCTQAFPGVFGKVTKYNKEKLKEFDSKIADLENTIEELKDTKNDEGIEVLKKNIEELKEEKKNYKPFKVGYGIELDMCESNLNVCYNANDTLIENQTFVVFDTETTGFNPGLGDSMIEIGGVKICHGEVVENGRFDELINPGHHIDEEITRVTNISDDDVKDADNEENVIKRFKEWIGDLPLVAHNARFDKNMLDMAYYKYDLGELKNPIIDTLMLSRVINRESKKHSLKALGKIYGVDTGEADDEENESGDNTSNAYQFTDDEVNIIKDIKVDGESILIVKEVNVIESDIATENNIEKKKKEVYLNTIYKASKTENVKIEIELADGYTLVDFDSIFKLHTAMNTCTFSYNTPFGISNFDIPIYVGQHHGADVDSENTGIIFAKMLKQIEGIKTLNELNDLEKLEKVAFLNNPKMQKNIGDLITYKNYIRKLEEDEEIDINGDYPLKDYENYEYVWKYPCSKANNLQMYENIPAKTITENTANIFDNIKHITMIAKNQKGLKNLFKLTSFANTNFLVRNARIPRKLVEEYRDGILVGSACLNGEIFYIAETRSDEELVKAMDFYDYIEIQPLENYKHLVSDHSINNMNHLKELVNKIIRCAKKAKKLLVATGDVHHLDSKDLLYREIIVNQNVPGKGRHPLAKYLRGKKGYNSNNDNIKSDIKNAAINGCELDATDIKVLKLIYALTPFEKYSLTPSINTICNLFVLDSNNERENTVKLSKNSEDKLDMIKQSLNRLKIANVVGIDYAKNGEYYIKNKYNKTKLAEMGHIPNQYFRTTKEMLDEFAWLKDKDLIKEIVIDNPNKLINMLDVIEVIDYPKNPYSPIIENSQKDTVDMVYEKASSMYGDPLPRLIEERIGQEFYGDKILGLIKDKIDAENPKLSEEEKDALIPKVLHEVIVSGYDSVIGLMKEKLRSDNQELNEEDLTKLAKESLGGIIGGGFDVIYLIAQKLVKHSNDEGYLVGSRGSVGSSFVASMMGITECNGLPPHYYCPKCCYSSFENENGEPYAKEYSSGFDLPNIDCPKCGTLMIHEGNDMPFATFLGFNADKVPDIDLNFSGENQASAHEYTKVLFGTDNVYRAGTIGTVADKTAYGYVQGYYEERIYDLIYQEAKSLGISITGKDELKKLGIIKSNIRYIEVERQAVGCTGVKRTTGQHPGGIVVVPGYKDIWDFTPFQYPADDATATWRTTHFDYHKIEADLLKLDILGHDNPTILRMLTNLTGVDVNKIDLGDLDTMKLFNGPEILGLEKDQLRGLTIRDKDGNVLRRYCPTGTLGVPEFGTSFILTILEETKPTTFGELIKISGLSHGTDVWLGNARDLCTPNEEGIIQVPFKETIGCRDDIMVNLMQMGLPSIKAFKIMEFVRKGRPSKPKDHDEWLGYVEYMREKNVPEWYIQSCQKIKYMFPKAHATAYVTSAFRIAWFKVHYPIMYYAAFMSIKYDQFDIIAMVKGEQAIRDRIDEIDDLGNKASNKEQSIFEVLGLCLEMTARGYYFKNIDMEKSDANNFVVTEDGKGLYIPFRALDGLGGGVAEAIVKARKEAPFISQEDLQNRGHVSKTLITKLKALGCLDGMNESNQLTLF